MIRYDGSVTKCHTCPTMLELGPAQPCAILICKDCRRDHEKLRRTREALTRHLAEHKLKMRETLPYWPFRDRFEANAFQEAA